MEGRSILGQKGGKTKMLFENGSYGVYLSPITLESSRRLFEVLK